MTTSILRFVNVLIVLICAAAAFGTIPESTLPFLKNPSALFAAKPFVAFLGLLGVFAVSHTVRKGIDLFRMAAADEITTAGRETRLQDFRPARIPFSDLQEYQDRISSVLRSKRYRVIAKMEKLRFSFTGVKDLDGIWGSFLVHAGLVVALLAGLLTYSFADVRDIELQEGATTLLARGGAKIKLEKFSVMLDATGNVASYVSRLLVQDRKGRIEHHDLSVNGPLQIGGVRVFQMRYSVKIREVVLRVYKNGKPFGEITLAPGKKSGLAGLPYTVEAGEIVPDFVIVQGGKAASRSPYFRNPAVSLFLYTSTSPDTPEKQIWVFSDLFLHQGAGPAEWAFAIGRIRKIYSSGMKVSYDPGWPLAYAGFVVMILGAFLSAFVIPRGIRISFVPERRGEESSYECSGACVKDPAGLKYEAGIILRELEPVVKGGGVR
ncbi:MAG: cytochrome c biogenesis protein ResB [Candidatus Omnitrophica bacterium]|nr:cytochrome c biogenesis protein ResB [Candidatus Omnitrophota bacterium]